MMLLAVCLVRLVAGSRITLPERRLYLPRLRERLYLAFMVALRSDTRLRLSLLLRL